MGIIISCNGNYECSSPSIPGLNYGCGGKISLVQIKIIRLFIDENRSKFFLKSNQDLSITKITVKRNSKVVASINYSYPFLQCKANKETLINEYPDVTQGSVWSFVFNGLNNEMNQIFHEIEASTYIY